MIAAIRHAVEPDVSWIGTVPVYRLERSEEAVAHTLEIYADSNRPDVFTKCRVVWDEGGIAFTRGMRDEN